MLEFGRKWWKKENRDPFSTGRGGCLLRIYVLGAHDLPATRVGRVMMMVPDVDRNVHWMAKLFRGR